MAIDTYAVFSASIQDEIPVRAVATSYVGFDSAQPLSVITTPWDTWITDLDAVVSGQIVGGHISIIPTLPSLASGKPKAGSIVVNGLGVDFAAVGTSKVYGQFVPCLDEANKSGGKPITTTGSAVDVLIQFMLAHGSTFEFENANRQRLSLARTAYASFRKHRKQTRRGTSSTPA